MNDGTINVRVVGDVAARFGGVWVPPRVAVPVGERDVDEALSGSDAALVGVVEALSSNVAALGAAVAAAVADARRADRWSGGFR